MNWWSVLVVASIVLAGALAISFSASNNGAASALADVFTPSIRFPAVTFVGCYNETCSQVFYCWNAHFGINEQSYCQGLENVSSFEDAKAKIAADLAKAWRLLMQRKKFADSTGYSALTGYYFEPDSNSLLPGAELGAFSYTVPKVSGDENVVAQSPTDVNQPVSIDQNVSTDANSLTISTISSDQNANLPPSGSDVNASPTLPIPDANQAPASLVDSNADGNHT